MFHLLQLPLACVIFGFIFPSTAVSNTTDLGPVIVTPPSYPRELFPPPLLCTSHLHFRTVTTPEADVSSSGCAVACLQILSAGRRRVSGHGSFLANATPDPTMFHLLQLPLASVIFGCIFPSTAVSNTTDLGPVIVTPPSYPRELFPPPLLCTSHLHFRTVTTPEADVSSSGCAVACLQILSAGRRRVSGHGSFLANATPDPTMFHLLQLPLACVIFGCIFPSTAVSNTTDLGPVIVTPPSYPRELFPPPLLCTSHLNFRTVTTPEADVSSSGCAVACLQILSAGRRRVSGHGSFLANATPDPTMFHLLQLPLAIVIFGCIFPSTAVRNTTDLGPVIVTPPSYPRELFPPPLLCTSHLHFRTVTTPEADVSSSGCAVACLQILSAGRRRVSGHGSFLANATPDPTTFHLLQLPLACVIFGCIFPSTAVSNTTDLGPVILPLACVIFGFIFPSTAVSNTADLGPVIVTPPSYPRELFPPPLLCTSHLHFRTVTTPEADVSSSGCAVACLQILSASRRRVSGYGSFLANATPDPTMFHLLQLPLACVIFGFIFPSTGASNTTDLDPVIVAPPSYPRELFPPPLLCTSHLHFRTVTNPEADLSSSGCAVACLQILSAGRRPVSGHGSFLANATPDPTMFHLLQLPLACVIFGCIFPSTAVSNTTDLGIVIVTPPSYPRELFPPPLLCTSHLHFRTVTNPEADLSSSGCAVACLQILSAGRRRVSGHGSFLANATPDPPMFHLLQLLLACVIFGCIFPSTAVSNSTDLGPVIVTPPSYPRELFPPPLLCTSHLHFRTVTTPEADVSSSGFAVACLQILSAGRRRVSGHGSFLANATPDPTMFHLLQLPLACVIFGCIFPSTAVSNTTDLGPVIVTPPSYPRELFPPHLLCTSHLHFRTVTNPEADLSSSGCAVACLQILSAGRRRVSGHGSFLANATPDPTMFHLLQLPLACVIFGCIFPSTAVSNTTDLGPVIVTPPSYPRELFPPPLLCTSHLHFRTVTNPEADVSSSGCAVACLQILSAGRRRVSGHGSFLANATPDPTMFHLLQLPLACVIFGCIFPSTAVSNTTDLGPVIVTPPSYPRELFPPPLLCTSHLHFRTVTTPEADVSSSGCAVACLQILSAGRRRVSGHGSFLANATPDPTMFHLLQLPLACVIFGCIFPSTAVSNTTDLGPVIVTPPSYPRELFPPPLLCTSHLHFRTVTNPEADLSSSGCAVACLQILSAGRRRVSGHGSFLANATPDPTMFHLLQLPLACVIFGCIFPSTAVSNTTDLGPVIVTPPSYPRELFPPPLLCTSHLHFRTVTNPEADVSSSGCAVACLQILSAGRRRVSGHGSFRANATPDPTMFHLLQLPLACVIFGCIFPSTAVSNTTDLGPVIVTPPSYPRELFPPPLLCTSHLHFRTVTNPEADVSSSGCAVACLQILSAGRRRVSGHGSFLANATPDPTMFHLLQLPLACVIFSCIFPSTVVSNTTDLGPVIVTPPIIHGSCFHHRCCAQAICISAPSLTLKRMCRHRAAQWPAYKY
ncbi:hypothetical protein ISCGN_024728 [Ixodes scapularis]